MHQSPQIKLKTESVLNITLDRCDDFYFIVNGKEIKTSSIISELLSPKISHIRHSDLTANSYIIDTKCEGDFSYILKLVNFQSQTIPANQIEFITEVLEILGNEMFEIEIPQEKATKDNVFDLLREHLQFKIYFSESISKEIEFIASNFYYLIEREKEKFKKMDIEIIKKIISNKNLVIRDESQLLKFVNGLYLRSSKYSQLYEFVLFENADKKAMEKFLTIYNINDITGEVWESIKSRLKQEVEKNENPENLRYKQISTNIL